MKFTKEKIIQIITEEVESLQNEGCHDIDHEGKMAIGQLQHIANYAMELQQMITPDMQLEAWVQSKLTLATDYISKVKHYLESQAQHQQHQQQMMHQMPIHVTET